MALIEISRLEKTYHNEGVETPVLRGIDLTLAAGDQLAVVGPSGAGKSTLLAIIGSLETPSAGTVLFDGRDIFRWKAANLDRYRNRDIGFVFQFHHLIDDFTVRENILLPLLIRGESERTAAQRADSLIDRLDLRQRAAFTPRHLSGGEQQRVAIARALVSGPRVVLADEPTGNLDREHAGQIFDLLLELNAELRTTLIVVTHNRELAGRISRQVLLHNGRIPSH